jgi:single-stranded DNA-binding protein
VIDALIAGRVYGKPTERTTGGGTPYATVKVRVPTLAGDALFANVIAFDEQPVGALLALSDGNSVALAGELTPKVYTDKEGNARPSVDLLAHRVLTHIPLPASANRCATSM